MNTWYERVICFFFKGYRARLMKRNLEKVSGLFCDAAGIEPRGEYANEADRAALERLRS